LLGTKDYVVVVVVVVIILPGVSISSNKIVSKFKYDMNLNFLNLATSILWTKKFLVTIEA
jgi:hypothetical protein